MKHSKLIIKSTQQSSDIKLNNKGKLLSVAFVTALVSGDGANRPW